MSASAVLSRTTLQVVPGDQAMVDVKVRNTGTVVDELSFEVVGDAERWASVEPLSVSLLPDGEATVSVRFTPPADPAPAAGEVPFAVAVSCREDRKGGVAEEGILEVLVRSDLSAEVVPRSAVGSLRRRVQIAVDNRGNSAVRAELTATDPSGGLRLAIDPYQLDLAAGTAGFAPLTIRPAKRLWWGPDQTRVYSVSAIPDEGEACETTATFVQRSIIPKWAPKALMAAVAALAILAVLWLTVLRPAIDRGADHAIEKAVKAGQVAAGPKAAAAGGGAAGAEAGAGGGALFGGGFDKRLVDGGAIDVPKDKVLRITDVVFSNPGAQLGTVQLLRGDEVLLQLTLANFRDLDYHFVSPILVSGGQSLRLVVKDRRKSLEAGERPKRLRPGQIDRGRQRVRRLVALGALVGVVGIGFGPARPTIRDAIEWVRDRTQAGEHVEAEPEGSSPSLEGHPVQLVNDTDPASWWAEDQDGPGDGSYVELSFDAPVDIDHVVIRPGAGDAWDAHGAPKDVNLVFFDPEGAEVANQDRHLKDADKDQTVSVRAKGVTAVRVTVIDTYEHQGEPMAITKLRFIGTETKSD